MSEARHLDIERKPGGIRITLRTDIEISDRAAVCGCVTVIIVVLLLVAQFGRWASLLDGGVF